MGLTGLLDGLRQVPGYRNLLEALAPGIPGRPAATMPDTAKPYVIAALWQHLARPVVLLTPHPDEARRLVDHLRAYLGDDAPVLHFAEAEVLPYERLSIEAGTAQERLGAMGALHAWVQGRSNSAPPIVVTSVTGAMQKTLAPETFDALVHTIKRDDRLLIDQTMERWVRMGYRVEPAVEEPGTAARRGGIIDIFPPGEPTAARLDLWGDVVDTIRLFDTRSQRSIEQIDELSIPPAAEVLPLLADATAVEAAVAALDYSNCRTAERDRINDDLADLLAGLTTDSASLYAGFVLHSTFLDHVRRVTGAVLVIDELSEIVEAAHHIEGGAEKLRLVKEERGDLPLGFPSMLVSWDELKAGLESWPDALEISRYHRPEAAGIATALPFGPVPSYQGALDRLAADLTGGTAGSSVLITQHARRVEEILRESDLGAIESEDLDGALQPGAVPVVHTSLAGGWSLREGEDDGRPLLTVLTDIELFGTHKVRVTRPKRHAARVRTTSVDELTPGQFVVHVEHGIGRFAGTIARPAADEDEGGAEYLVLEYADGDRLYVPMEQLDRIAPYVGGDESDPSPTRLGTQEWTRAVSRAKESTKKLAVDLLALYAKRETAPGFGHEPDTPWQREMEDAFPYVETPDQAQAIDQVKDDLEQDKPMDRLICGDVGYGKTEVALRAAFKAAMSGKQVALLVPTTVLAQQHYNTFAERLAPFPLKVEVLSRFRTDQEQRAIVQRLKRGEIDIVVGTHRLVQRDVDFKDLGLVIIDEEHRFGVGHKERLKELRSEVDVLTLTATPIPRTLHLALAGVRDISTIETPPEERLPIRTFLAETSDDLVREAIQRELDRGGQVYYLHNRVRSIDLVAGKIRELVPDARVLVGHGQMPEEDLADVMDSFADGEADVLVCTTIIESGLDIPAVNTLIVERADRLGLAQLYQLRGRIGRRSQRAYAYLMVEPGRKLTDTAQRRLQTIVAATELGAGFRIAMKDLEIRGAGNILGAEQSGQIHAVGFDLYSRLLAEAVAELRASTGMGPSVAEAGPDPVVDLGLPASIAEELVPHMPTRMAVYQRVANARTLEDVDDLNREFQDRFGRVLPDEAHHLLYAVRVKVLARMAGVEGVARRNGRITLKLQDQVGGARIPLERALGYGARVGNQQIHLPETQTGVPWGQALLETLRRLGEFRQQAHDLLEATSRSD